MKIEILGSADMNSLSFSASYLINGRVLVDIPEGTCRRLKELGHVSEDMEAVLITHLHGDHILGLPVWALKKTKRLPAPEDGSIHICADESQKAMLEHLICSSFATSFSPEKTGRFFRWTCDGTFSLDNLQIRRIAVKHGSLPDCFGYLVSDKAVTVGFTGDSCMCEGVREIASNVDLIFCDCDLVEGNEKHMGIDDVEALAYEFPNVHIIASHLKDETRAVLARKRIRNVTAADDGAVYQL